MSSIATASVRDAFLISCAMCPSFPCSHSQARPFRILCSCFRSLPMRPNKVGEGSEDSRCLLFAPRFIKSRFSVSSLNCCHVDTLKIARQQKCLEMLGSVLSSRLSAVDKRKG